jgi:6-phosphogluconolactonase
MNNGIETFGTAKAAGEAAAGAVADALRGTGPRTFVATGGRTPGPAFDALSQMDLGWGEITVTQTDERFVDREAKESNEKLLRDRLLTGRASRAAFLGFKGDGATPQADAAAAETKLRALLPSAAVLLGVGDDGHIASIFPKDPELAAHLDPAGDALCFGTDVADDPPFVPRISLTVRALLETGLIAILVSGEGKRALIQRVLDDPTYSPPCAAILRQDRVPVRILWAP